jgi:hypothetical protein
MATFAAGESKSNVASKKGPIPSKTMLFSRKEGLLKRGSPQEHLFVAMLQVRTYTYILLIIHTAVDATCCVLHCVILEFSEDSVGSRRMSAGGGACL